MKTMLRKRSRVGSKLVIISGSRFFHQTKFCHQDQVFAFSLFCNCLCWLPSVAGSCCSKKNACLWQLEDTLVLSQSGEREKYHSLKYATKQNNSNKNSSLSQDWPNLVQGTKSRPVTCLEILYIYWLGLIGISLLNMKVRVITRKLMLWE